MAWYWPTPGLLLLICVTSERKSVAYLLAHFLEKRGTFDSALITLLRKHGPVQLLSKAGWVSLRLVSSYFVILLDQTNFVTG